MKLTPWFPGHIKPKRVGVYQQLSAIEKRLGYQRWDGKKWSPWFSKAEDAACYGRECAPAAEEYQNDPWRGLAERPSK